MHIIPEIAVNEEYHNKLSQKNWKKNCMVFAGTGSIAMATKTKVVGCIGQFIASSGLGPVALTFVAPACLGYLYKEYFEDEFDCDAVTNDLSNLLLIEDEVDVLLMRGVKRIKMNISDIELNRKILEGIIDKTFGARQELLFFNPTEEKSYCLRERGYVCKEIRVCLRYLQESLENGLNFRGVIVKYTRFLLDKVLIPDYERGYHKVVLYEYNLALSQIIAALRELKILKG